MSVATPMPVSPVPPDDVRLPEPPPPDEEPAWALLELGEHDLLVWPRVGVVVRQGAIVKLGRTPKEALRNPPPLGERARFLGKVFRFTYCDLVYFHVSTLEWLAQGAGQ